MTTSKYLVIRDFNKHIVPIQGNISSIGLSELVFEDGLNPNSYMLSYSLVNRYSHSESDPIRIVVKLNPYLPTKTTVKLLENIPVGIGYDLLLQFAALEGINKPNRIAVRVEYQVYL